MPADQTAEGHVLLADSETALPGPLSARRGSPAVHPKACGPRLVIGALCGAATLAAVSQLLPTGRLGAARTRRHPVLRADEEGCAEDDPNCGGDDGDAGAEEDGICTSSGSESCLETRCCSHAGKTCFKKGDGWAACRSSCDPDEKDPYDNQMWSCEVLGGFLTEAGMSCQEGDCSECTSGGDCSKTQCCSMPGMQCFQKSDVWANCNATCNKDYRSGDGYDDNKGWTCVKLGKRTPGDSHYWSPCEPDEGSFPTLSEDPVGAWDSAESRAKKLLATLTMQDKIVLLHGQNSDWPNDRHGYAGYINPQSALGNDCAMPLTLNDGPQGYNHYQTDLSGTSTQFPCLLAVAASFDPKVSKNYAGAIADEFVAKGSNVLLGPDIEVMRAPLTGRSFETLTGEDPFLGASLVGPYVQAVQERGIIVTIKHWLDNNQEIFRMTMNVNVDDRTQYEIYMPVFKAAIKAGASAVMCSYQKVYDTYACENKRLLKTLLREELGFRGFIMSDWGATHDARRSAEAGLDVEMPGGDDDEFRKLEKLVKRGKISEETIDKMAGHVLTSMYAVGQFDGKFHFVSADASLHKDTTSDENRDLARQTIIDGAVLLKNKAAVLPLRASSLSKVALVGKYCDQVTDKSYGQGDTYAGGGSGWVISNRTISIYQGIKKKLKSTKVTKSKHAAGAKGADVAVVCLAAHSEEGWDRESIEMPEAKLVDSLRAQDPEQTIVVIGISPGAVTAPWVKKADAALLLFMPGEQVGTAVADLLVGDDAPGGRLPVSLPEAGEERFTSAQYPGEPFNDVNMTAKFSEGVLVGYRWNVAKGVPSAFPFGFGLSYTEFEYGTPTVEPKGAGAKITVKVSNVGKHDGSDVPQLYVGFPSLKPALNQLRGFHKVHVPAGGSRSATFVLGPEDWSFYDEAKSKWVSAADLGETITVSMGRSSVDFFWSATLTLRGGKMVATKAPGTRSSQESVSSLTLASPAAPGANGSATAKRRSLHRRGANGSDTAKKRVLHQAAA